MQDTSARYKWRVQRTGTNGGTAFWDQSAFNQADDLTTCRKRNYLPWAPSERLVTHRWHFDNIISPPQTFTHTLYIPLPEIYTLYIPLPEIYTHIIYPSDRDLHKHFVNQLLFVVFLFTISCRETCSYKLLFAIKLLLSETVHIKNFPQWD